MNLKEYYWYFKSALPKSFCEEVIKYALNKQEQLALIGKTQEILEKKGSLDKKEINNLKKQRNSNIVWLNEKWIYKEITPFIHLANKNAGWNFEWDWSETCQFTKYKKGQFYDWHSDSWEKPYDCPNDLNLHGKIRKLSVTCSLSDPSTYKGGELEFDFRNDVKNKIRVCKEILPQGSIVVFPSHVWHRVKPVLKGTRYSLVVWNCGKPFI